MKKNFLLENIFTVLQRMEKLVMMVKYQTVTKKIWDKFNMKNVGDYHNHYLKKDVLFMTDVFEKFIDTFLKYYGLDPCHYFSSPGMSWDAMLKMTDEKLEEISNIDKYLFIEKGFRQGISYIAKRYAKANNKYMNDYDPKNSQHLYHTST